MTSAPSASTGRSSLGPAFASPSKRVPTRPPGNYGLNGTSAGWRRPGIFVPQLFVFLAEVRSMRRFLILLSLVALVATACTAHPNPSRKPTGSGTAGAQASVGPETAPGGGGGGEVLGEIAVTAVDLGFEPKALTGPKAGRYEVHFQNNEQIPHDITFADGTTATA